MRKKKQCTLVDFDLSITINHQKIIPVNPNFLEGTLPYISPEQSGRMNRGIDYRTDYYSLGVLFYRALTGELPFFPGIRSSLSTCISRCSLGLLID